METKKLNKHEELDDEQFMEMLRMEREWKESLPRFSKKELLEIFPEAIEIIPDKIKEWEEVYQEQEQIIYNKLKEISHSDYDETSKYLLREAVKDNNGKKLVEAEGHIQRLKSYLYKPKKGKFNVTDDDIQQALAVPIQNLLDIKLRQSGDKLFGLCPLHNERTPSFCIYTKTNSFCCFGCQKGGDVINLVRYLNGYDFVEAVRYIINK